MSSLTHTPSQRAFVGKRNKMTAADARKIVMTGSVSLHPAPIDVPDGSPTQLSLVDIVDPVDVENALEDAFVQRKTSALYDISSLTSSPRKVSEFPDDDIEVRIVAREQHTLDMPCKSTPSSVIDPHVKDMVLSFTDSFALVQRRYQQFGSGDAYMRMVIERPIVARGTSRPVFETDGVTRRQDRVARSASVVADCEVGNDNVSKRNSYSSLGSTATMGSVEGERETKLHWSQPDPIVPGVIQRASFAQLDQLNDSKRSLGRQPNLVNLLPIQNESDIIERRSSPSYPDDRTGQKLLVKVLKLSLEPYFEPLFGSIAIYDIKSKRKVTENFHFDINSDAIRCLIPALAKESEPMGRCSQGCFSINVPLLDLFLVIKLDKVLHASDVIDGSEPYSNPAKDEKTREKLAHSATEYCSKLGGYRSPLGFMIIDLQKVVCGADTLERSDIMTASTFTNAAQGEARLACGESDVQSIVSADRISLASTSTFKRVGSGTSAVTVLNRVRTPLARRKLFGGGGDDSTLASTGSFDQQKSSQSELASLANLQPLTLSLNSFFRLESDKCSEEDLFKYLADARKPGGKLSKLKTFPVSMQIQFSGSTGEELLRRLTPELLRVAPFSSDVNAELTKDVQEFAGKGQYAVNTSYRNTLYVNPRAVNMSNRQGTARNISIKVEMMNSSEIAQRVVFPSNSGTMLNTSAHTSVIYHCKTPQFADEIKMKLPLEIDDGYHLLFTFYHISCKIGAKEDEFEYPIGYSWLPIFRNGKLESGEFSLPICLERPPKSYGYLTPDGALPNIKWLDGHKQLFDVNISAVSTIHSQDNYLENFFLAVSSLVSNDRKRPPVSEPALISAIQGVLKSRPEPMVAFLYNVLDKLFFLIAQPPYSDTVSIVCFETLGHLVKICTMLLDSCLDAHGRSSILISYLHYFKISLKESQPRSELCRAESAERQKPMSPESQKLFHIIEEVERSSNLRESLHDAQSTRSPNKTVHEEIAELWTRSGGQSRDMSFMNSWFFLELMMKSMAEYLSMTGRLYLVRRSRFGERFIKALNSLSAAIAAEVCNRVIKDARQSSALVNSWAFFLRDAFSIMDRTYVMGLVRDFNQALTMKISCSTEPSVTNLMMLKLDFLRIISSQEHFVILNLPFSQSVLTASITSSISKDSTVPTNIQFPSQSNTTPRSPSSASVGNRSTGTTDSWSSLGSGELSVEFRRCHYLIGLALADLSAVLETSPSSLLHSRAIGLVRNLLATHEADSRLSDHSVKARVAALYLPFVSIVLDAHSQIYDPYGRMPASDRSRFSSDESSSSPGVNPKVALAIAGVGGPPSPPVLPTDGKIITSSPRKTKLSLGLSRQLLCCVCCVLKNMDPSALRHWIRELPPQRLSQLLSILQLCISCFEYKNSQVDSESVSTIDTEDVQADRREGVRWRRGTPVKTTDSFRTSALLCDDESLLEASLSSEITLCVLDVVETVARVISMPGCDHLHFSLPVVLRQIMHMLACNQSVTSLESIFATQRALIVKYPELVFEQEIEQCGELCLQLLRHCASKLPSIRSQAAASLYLLMRESFESGTNLSRVKMQITMSLSTLVSCGTRIGMWLNEDCLRRSLKTVLIYSETDINTDVQLRLNASFSEQVKDLVFNLHMILSDTVKMKEYANDFEMTLDLMYRVAKGYQNNPDLRLTWLLNMAARHSERGLHCEAAQCMLHSAALAAEYIAMTSTDGYMPPGAVSFFAVSENVMEESAVSDDVVSPETDGICESRHFTASGLVQLVEKTGALLEKAQMYELLADLYKVVEPILREWRDYRRLSVIHGRLSEALAKVEPLVPIVEDIADAWVSPLRSADKRSFGTYFRVGFYGPGFGDLDGEEYIYKEPPFTKLSEISHRLESFYSDRFGRGAVEVIKDSNNVIRTSHDSSKVYLQVTYVEPYFDKWERKKRATHFERNHVLKRFSYATPFTKDGRAHGDLKDQYKRRTILTTLHSFPYVKTRIRVVEREQKVLQPIQVAIEDVEKKTRELSAAIHQSPPDAKMLQMVLQGCIGTTVNQGPVQVANVFLTDVSVDSRGRPVDKLQNKLRLAFRDFSKKCSDALTLNKQLIQPDQFAYQSELEKNYAEFQRQMAPILTSTKRQSILSAVELMANNETHAILVV